MKARLILVLLIVFVAGVVLGIWLDWRHRTTARNIVYQVQDYQRANVEVHPGDTISLVTPGGKSDGLQMDFIGHVSPCPHAQNPAKCLIEENAAEGPYFFTCSGGGYSCPDPGVQQSPTIPIELTFEDALKIDFFGVHSAPREKHGTTPIASQPATTAVRAYVACDTTDAPNITELLNLDGNSFNPITASGGQSVFWISSIPFTMDTSNFPAGFCSNSNPGGSNLTSARCDIPLSYKGTKTLTYTVQSQTTPNACPVLANAQLKIN